MNIAAVLLMIQHLTVTCVTVLNSDFEIVSRISRPESLLEFEILWEDRDRAADSLEPDFTMKVDIENDSGSTRWLYAPEGYARVLSKMESPLFVFNRREALAGLLLPNKPAELPEESP